MLNLFLLFQASAEAAESRLMRTISRLNGLKSRSRRVEHMTWPYLEGGRGEALVLLHGYGADKDRMAALLPWAARSFRVFIPDLPGFGEHVPDWRAGYGIVSQTDRLHAFIKACGLRRFHLLGISLGGYLAGCYAARFRDRVQSLTLMDPAGVGACQPSDLVRLHRRTGRNLFLFSTLDEVRFFMDSLFFSRLYIPERVGLYWVRTVAAKLAWRRKIFDDLVSEGTDGLDGLAQRITAPTLILWGGEDRICHVSGARTLLDRIADSRAVIFRRCGHIPLLEHSRACRGIMMRFLKGQRV